MQTIFGTSLFYKYWFCNFFSKLCISFAFLGPYQEAWWRIESQNSKRTSTTPLVGISSKLRPIPCSGKVNFEYFLYYLFWKQVLKFPDLSDSVWLVWNCNNSGWTKSSNDWISLSLAQGILKCFNSDTINLAIVYFNIPSKNHKNGINHPHLISTS